MNPRAAGILLHLTSVPGPHGVGDLGAGARSVADWLHQAGQRWWQLLPIHPVGQGNSPYSGASAFAGEPMLVSLRDLVDDGLLEARDVAETVAEDRADYAAARALHGRLLRKAFERHRPTAEQARFEREAAHWLDDYAWFTVMQETHPGASWVTWPEAIRRREPTALARLSRDAAPEIARVKLEQFLFARQWERLRTYCAERGIGLVGDIPIFVAQESADVWAHRSYFTLDDDGAPTHVAGVPPDYFSKTGQRWGNPLYNWQALERDGYRWWIDRFEALRSKFAQIRLDHFIGFSRFWEIPASEPTAEKGRYVDGPGAKFFEAVRGELGELPFIAEDLGEITPAVRELRDRFELPGMRVFQFGFGNDSQASDFKPHRFPRRCVAYTGTHDNDTIGGWFDEPGPRSAEQHALERAAVIEYLAGPGAKRVASPIHREILRALYASVAELVIAPLQDVLGLGNEARMNVPGAAEGNWGWRVPSGALTRELADDLRALARIYDRLEEI